MSLVDVGASFDYRLISGDTRVFRLVLIIFDGGAALADILTFMKLLPDVTLLIWDV